MKKTILFFGIVAGIFTANAQTEATTNVTVNLKKTQSISVNHSSVVLDYSTPTHYLQGVESQLDNHLNFFSTGKYTISFKADTSSLLNDENTAIKILSSPGTPGVNSQLTYKASKELPLSTVEQPLGIGAAAETGTVNVKYIGAKDNLYLNRLDSTDGVAADTALSTNVIYTITAG